MKVNANISVNSNVSDISTCVYMWTAVMIRGESVKGRERSSQTSLLCCGCSVCMPSKMC